MRIVFNDTRFYYLTTKEKKKKKRPYSEGV